MDGIGLAASDLETGHPREAMKLLESMDAPPEWIRAIASHADSLGVLGGAPRGGEALPRRTAFRL
ncbi:MAG: hypothetical protein ACR2NB_10265, partial [Solirubrobacteraceae bacterium]